MKEILFNCRYLLGLDEEEINDCGLLPIVISFLWDCIWDLILTRLQTQLFSDKWLLLRHFMMCFWSLSCILYQKDQGYYTFMPKPPDFCQLLLATQHLPYEECQYNNSTGAEGIVLKFGVHCYWQHIMLIDISKFWVKGQCHSFRSKVLILVMFLEI